MCNEKYNGWANYETWLAALWLDNDEFSQGVTMQLMRNAWKDAKADWYLTRAQAAASKLADTLKALIEEDNPLEDQATMYADLMNAAIGEVDFCEIAEHYISDLVNENCPACGLRIAHCICQSVEEFDLDSEEVK